MGSFHAFRPFVRKISQSYVKAKETFAFYSVLSPDEALCRYESRIEHNRDRHDYVQMWIRNHIIYDRKNPISNGPVASGSIRNWYENDVRHYRYARRISSSLNTYFSVEEFSGALIYAGHNPVGSNDADYTSYFFFEVKYKEMKIT